MASLLPCGILADDLTGACDTGVQFSARGARVCVQVGGRPRAGDGDWAVAVLDTESRALPPQEAAQRAGEGAGWLASAGRPLRYKKIDSTLRGNLVAEIAPLLREPGTTVLVTPAFPPAGRTVEGGVLRVHGTPVHETELGRDPLTPVPESDLRRIFGRALDAPVGHLTLEDARWGVTGLLQRLAQLRAQGRHVIVADATEEEHLARLAAALLPVWGGGGPEAPGSLVVVGSAGMARALAAGLLPKARPAALPPGFGESRGPVLVVAGSRQQVTRTQVERLAARDDTAWHPLDPARLEADGELAVAGALVNAMATDAGRGRRALVVAVRAAAGEGAPAAAEASAAFLERSRRINRALGLVVAEAPGRLAPAGLVLTGGDIALAALAALETSTLQLGPEVLPGIPLAWTVGGRRPGLPVITKAGGFGGPEALEHAARVLADGPGALAQSA